MLGLLSTLTGGLPTIHTDPTKGNTPTIMNFSVSIGAVILYSLQHVIAPFLNLLPLLQSLIPQACKQGSKSKAGAIKCCKENKITAPPNEWHNIPFEIWCECWKTFLRSAAMTSSKYLTLFKPVSHCQNGQMFISLMTRPMF